MVKRHVGEIVVENDGEYVRYRCSPPVGQMGIDNQQFQSVIDSADDFVAVNPGFTITVNVEKDCDD